MLEDLFKDNDLEQVSNFESMYDSLTLKHETMASAETVVERSDIQTGGGGGIGAMMIMLLSLLVAVRRCLREKTVLRDQLPFRNLFDTGLRRKPLMRTSVNQ
jgi:hypothetical protein